MKHKFISEEGYFLKLLLCHFYHAFKQVFLYLYCYDADESAICKRESFLYPF